MNCLTFVSTFFSLFFILNQVEGQTWVQKGLDIEGINPYDRDGTSVALNSDGNVIAIGGPGSYGSSDGHVRIFEWNGMSWVQKGSTIADAVLGNEGWCVSITPDGNTVALGFSNFGPVTRVYQWNGIDWIQKGGDIPEGGTSVDISDDGNMLVTTGSDGPGGEIVVKVFIYDFIVPGDWAQIGTNIPGEEIGENPGKEAISISGNGQYVMYGSPYNSGNGPNAGNARIFNGGWSQSGTDIDGVNSQDQAGCAVDLNYTGTICAVGARFNDVPFTDLGHVRVFENVLGSWTLRGSQIDGWGGTGRSLELDASGNRIIIGGLGGGLNGLCEDVEGLSRVFDWDGNNWVQVGQDIFGVNFQDKWGYDVSISDDGMTIAGGAIGNDANGTEAGHVRIFSYCTVTNGAIDTTVCQGPFVVPSGDETYFVSGVYSDTLTNANGCDSILTIDLTVNYSSTGTDVVTACDSYTWIDANTYTSSTNSPTWTLTNSQGCDSIVTLDLTVNYSSTGTDVVTACDSYTWIDANTYTSSTNSPMWTLTNEQGCDSIVTLDLTINYSNTGTDVVTVCDSYTWIDANTYTSSTNSPTWTLTNTQGCDSLVTLNLTINSASLGTDVQIACDSFTWIDGNTYTSSTTAPSWTLTNQAGCDSVVTLDLIINNVDNGTSQINDTTLEASAIGAQYQWLDCDNNFALLGGEINQTFNATNNGNYAVQVTENGCIDTSACIPITTIGIIESELAELIVSPNPTSGQFIIDLGREYHDVEIEIVNSLGQLAYKVAFNDIEYFEYRLLGERGVYFIRITCNDRNVVVPLIKN